METTEIIEILKDVQLSMVQLLEFVDGKDAELKSILTVNIFILKQKLGYILEELTKPNTGIV